MINKEILSKPKLMINKEILSKPKLNTEFPKQQTSILCIITLSCVFCVLTF